MRRVVMRKLASLVRSKATQARKKEEVRREGKVRLEIVPKVLGPCSELPVASDLVGERDSRTRGQERKERRKGR